MPCACARLSFSGLERVVAAFFIFASTSTAIALTLAFNEWGLLVLAVSYMVAFFLLLVLLPSAPLSIPLAWRQVTPTHFAQTGLTKWRPFKHCCYEKAGNHHHDHTKHNEFGGGKGAGERDEVL
jgi:hypothetical protein